MVVVHNITAGNDALFKINSDVPTNLLISLNTHSPTVEQRKKKMLKTTPTLPHNSFTPHTLKTTAVGENTFCKMEPGLI